jgi:hypothetical protein
VDEKVITADHCKLKKSIMVSKCQLSMWSRTENHRSKALSASLSSAFWSR